MCESKEYYTPLQKLGSQDYLEIVFLSLSKITNVEIYHMSGMDFRANEHWLPCVVLTGYYNTLKAFI